VGHPPMIESRVGAMGALLSWTTRERGDRFSFLTRDLYHYQQADPHTRYPYAPRDGHPRGARGDQRGGGVVR
jgi:hypothetical protein